MPFIDVIVSELWFTHIGMEELKEIPDKDCQGGMKTVCLQFIRAFLDVVLIVGCWSLKNTKINQELIQNNKNNVWKILLVELMQ